MTGIKKRRSGSRFWRRNLRNGLLFTSPRIIGMIVFLLYPIGASIYYSLTRYEILTPPEFLGFQNYLTLIRDDVFWKSLYNTTFYFAIGLPSQLISAFLIALLLNTKIRGLAFYRAIVFIPTIVPTVVSAMVWRWIFNADVGLANAILLWFGVRGPAWLGSPSWAKPSLILMSLWLIGGTVIIFLASLQDVPKEIYEAADIDGASPFRKTINITMPMISPVILFNLIIGIIYSFQYFTEAFIMTGGGPVRATTFYALYLYENAFRFFRMGYASAQAWILFLIVLGLSLIVLKTSARWTYYAGK